MSTQDYAPTSMFHEAHGDFFDKKERYHPEIAGSVMLYPGAKLSNEPGSFDLWSFKADGIVPIVVDPDSVVLAGAGMEVRRYQASSGFGAEDETVFTPGLHLGFGRFVSDELYVEATFSPGINSDFDGGLKRDDWRFYGEAMATYAYTDTVYFKGGIQVNEVFDDVPVYPVGGVAWLFHPDWRLDLLVPRVAELSYAFDSATTLFAGIDLNGDKYHIRSSSATGKVQSDIHSQELTVYVGGIRRFNDNLSAFARFGGAIAGNNEFKTPFGGFVDGRIEPTVMFELGVGWDF